MMFPEDDFSLSLAFPDFDIPTYGEVATQTDDLGLRDLLILRTVPTVFVEAGTRELYAPFEVEDCGSVSCNAVHTQHIGTSVSSPDYIFPATNTNTGNMMAYILSCQRYYVRDRRKINTLTLRYTISDEDVGRLSNALNTFAGRHKLFLSRRDTDDGSYVFVMQFRTGTQ
jgi:hypothetical protein